MKKLNLKKVHVANGRNTGLCGKENVTTVSRAWGFWGPTGKGWGDVCKTCAKVDGK